MKGLARKNAKIHATAIVSEEAILGEGVEIGPYTLVGPRVRIGPGTRVLNNVVIDGRTQIGERCVIHTGACIGTPPQDKRYKEEYDTGLRIGDDNVIREYVTINVGTHPGSETLIGSRNLFMIGSHVAHDCTLGNDIVIANTVALSGHVTVEDWVVIGGLAAIHQFVRVGKYAMIGGLSRVVMDIPPFSLCNGQPARFYSANLVGLRRTGFSSKEISALKAALRTLFGSGLRLSSAAQKIAEEYAADPQVQYVLSFIKDSKRGITRASRGENSSED